jgi:hypothetical protein
VLNRSTTMMKTTLAAISIHTNSSYHPEFLGPIRQIF